MKFLDGGKGSAQPASNDTHMHQLVTVLLLQRVTSCVACYYSPTDSSSTAKGTADYVPQVSSEQGAESCCWATLTAGRHQNRLELNLLPVNEANVSLIEPNEFYQAHSQWQPAPYHLQQEHSVVFLFWNENTFNPQWRKVEFSLNLSKTTVQNHDRSYTMGRDHHLLLIRSGQINLSCGLGMGPGEHPHRHMENMKTL